MNTAADRLGRWVGILALAMALPPAPAAPAETPESLPGSLAAWWSFDERSTSSARDGVSGTLDAVEGRIKPVDGVSGAAIRLDGFTSLVRRLPSQAPRLGQQLSVEAWVALAAYPWNWAPIVDHQQGRAGYDFGIGPRGELGLHLVRDNTEQRCESEPVLPLREWAHVAVTHDGARARLFVNGAEVASCATGREWAFASGAELRIGRNHEKRAPSHPVRPQATLPAWYSLDGILDEVKIHREAVAADELRASFEAVTPAASPDIPPRVMPSGSDDPAPFGAYYTELEYYPEWDALWPVSRHADVVVRFDDSPIRVVFWRGTRYSPVWVMENGLWMADQSAETFNDVDGCFEHMLDPHTRFSHVRIIESTPARVVVHWRYAPVSAAGHVANRDVVSGWEDWVDEYYTFYPDGIGVRKVVLHTSGSPLHPSELIVLCHPGQRPEDVVHLDALTLVNLEGEKHTYSWADDTPDFGDEPLPANPVIQVVNMRSEHKPFEIFEPGARMRVFRIEQRKDVSRFPWWNHWPVAQVPSDGRYAVAPDRASHFSLSWGGPPVHPLEGGGGYWSTWLYGTTRSDPSELAPLARSWAHAPEIGIEGDGWVSRGYDRGQRSYVLERTSPGAPAAVAIAVEASEASPSINPAFLLRGWGDGEAVARLETEGAPAAVEVRLGNVRQLGQRGDLVVYVPQRATAPFRLELEAAPERR